jgi:hypothetical protein
MIGLTWLAIFSSSGLDVNAKSTSISLTWLHPSEGGWAGARNDL